jgi:hypothetical protein
MFPNDHRNTSCLDLLPLYFHANEVHDRNCSAGTFCFIFLRVSLQLNRCFIARVYIDLTYESDLDNVSSHSK